VDRWSCGVDRRVYVTWRTQGFRFSVVSGRVTSIDHEYLPIYLVSTCTR